jgi:phosphate transport system substrate-binding protein
MLLIAVYMLANKLALAFGILAFVSSCTATFNSFTQTQLLIKFPKVSNSTKVRAIKIDGSSTVYPITEAIAKEFQSDPKNNAQVQVNFSGTSRGFEKFCAGETDISNASRPILKEEMEACNKNGVRYYEFTIAFDAITVAVNPQNDWAKDITRAELKKIWELAAEAKNE